MKAQLPKGGSDPCYKESSSPAPEALGGVGSISVQELSAARAPSLTRPHWDGQPGPCRVPSPQQGWRGRGQRGAGSPRAVWRGELPPPHLAAANPAGGLGRRRTLVMSV